MNGNCAHLQVNTGTSVLVPYQEIIELMEENNVTTAYIDWTVYAIDGTDTLEADNAPFSLIVDGENALSILSEKLIPVQKNMQKQSSCLESRKQIL